MSRETNKLQWEMTSKLGPLFLVASGQGLCGVFWKKQPVPMCATLSEEGAAVLHLRQTAAELEEYLRGKRKAFTLHLDPAAGTDFQRKVWEELARIPYGATISYAELARKIRNEKAVRAVGTANGRNPLSIIVPCHRVIASDGSLGGYAGGLENKSKLLALEAVEKF